MKNLKAELNGMIESDKLVRHHTHTKMKLFWK